MDILGSTFISLQPDTLGSRRRLDDTLGNHNPAARQMAQRRSSGPRSIVAPGLQRAVEVVKISPATLKRDWSIPRAWLRSEISR
jgi:hypothetical protein